MDPFIHIRRKPIETLFQGNLFSLMAVTSCFLLLSAIVNSAFSGLLDHIMLFAFLGLGGTTILSVIVIHREYSKELKRRINENSPTIGYVFMNGVKVGEILDADYARICLQVICDKRTYVAQALNWGAVCLRAIQILFVLIPIGYIWGLIALALYSPQSVHDIFAVIQSAEPTALAVAVKDCLSSLSSYLLFGLYLFMALDISSFGYSNRFLERIASAICMHCGSHVIGNITVTWRISESKISQ